MKYIEILECLKSALDLRFEEKKVYKKRVADLLGLDISLVNRRFSGALHFSLEEVSVICEGLEIPVEEVFCGGVSKARQRMEFIQTGLSFSNEDTRGVLDWSVDLFSFAARSDDSTFYVTCNTFPNILHPSFDWVARFSGLQWLFFNKGRDGLMPISEIVHPAGMESLMERYLSAIHSLKKSVYIVSSGVVENYITDIRRFFLFGFISREEVVCLIGEIEAVLDLFERVCTNGALDNGKEMEIYCTDLFLPADMYVMWSDVIKFAVLHPNQLNPVITQSAEVCDTMIRWFEVWRRSANLISLTGTLLRREFMDVQRGVLESFNREIES